jgi:hypothetical protein
VQHCCRGPLVIGSEENPVCSHRGSPRFLTFSSGPGTAGSHLAAQLG